MSYLRTPIRLTVEAALEGSYTKALTLNRTAPSADVAKRLIDDLLQANRDDGLMLC